MTRDPQSASLLRRPITGQWFTADEAGITALKRQIRKGANKYLVLRKGEDFGALIQMFCEAFARGPEAIQAVYQAYSAAPGVDLTGISLDALLENDFAQWLLLYNAIAKGAELTITKTMGLAEILHEATNYVRGVKVQILCNPDPPDEVNIKAGLGWRALFCEVRNYLRPEDAGTHRYYASDKEVAFFVRFPDQTFSGFYSTDSELINDFETAFQLEWDMNKK